MPWTCREHAASRSLTCRQRVVDMSSACRQNMSSACRQNAVSSSSPCRENDVRTSWARHDHRARVSSACRQRGANVASGCREGAVDAPWTRRPRPAPYGPSGGRGPGLTTPAVSARSRRRLLGPQTLHTARAATRPEAGRSAKLPYATRERRPRAQGSTPTPSPRRGRWPARVERGDPSPGVGNPRRNATRRVLSPERGKRSPGPCRSRSATLPGAPPPPHQRRRALAEGTTLRHVGHAGRGGRDYTRRASLSALAPPSP